MALSRRGRRVVLVCVMVPAVFAAGCGASSRSGAVGKGEEAGTWTRLDDPPISGRTGASVVAVGDRVFVFGGWDFTCPPTADCVLPDEPPFRDGAALDLVTGDWEIMAEMPAGTHHVETAVAGSDIYALSQCEDGPTCPAGRTLLRYQTVDDIWETLPPPSDRGYFHLASFAGGIVAYVDSDEFGAVPDYSFDLACGRWTALPDDPLPVVYDRQVVDFDGTLMVFGSPINGSTDTKLGARFDPETNGWEMLPESGTLGYQVWRSGDLLYLNPHFGSSGRGGVYDPHAAEWAPFPAAPDAESWRNDMAGIIGDGQGTFEYSAGWVLDTDREAWVEVPTRPGADEIYDESVADAGPTLLVFGGQTWTDSTGALLNETWMWRAE